MRLLALYWSAAIREANPCRQVTVWGNDGTRLIETWRRRIEAAFPDKNSIEDEIVQKLDLRDWAPDLIDQLTAANDQNVQDIPRIQGVTHLTT